MDESYKHNNDAVINILVTIAKIGDDIKEELKDIRTELVKLEETLSKINNIEKVIDRLDDINDHFSFSKGKVSKWLRNTKTKE